MITDKLAVLQVEDNPDHILFVKDMLQKVYPPIIDLTVAERLHDAIDILKNKQIDAILLDLSLPDSQGIETYNTIKQAGVQVPVVIVTGLQDEELGIQAVKAGAQDYLIKGEFDSKLLVRALRYACERFRLLTEIQQLRKNEEQTKEMESLALLAAEPLTSTTAQSFGLGPMKDIAPDAFEQIVQRYGSLLEQAIEEDIYRVDHNVSKNLLNLAKELYFLKVGPRDVIDIHTVSLKQKAAIKNIARAEAYWERGRLMVLELMGFLMNLYRIRALNLSRNDLNYRSTDGQWKRSPAHNEDRV